MSRISYKELSEMLTYDPEQGKLFWKEGYGARYSGMEAGYLHDVNIGRYKVKYKNKRYFRSRLAWVVYYGEEPNGFIDHINGDKADDRICNLRDVTRVENALNSKMNRNNKTGFTGVREHKGKFYVTYRKDRLGSYDTLEEAVLVRWEAEDKCPYITDRHGK